MIRAITGTSAHAADQGLDVVLVLGAVDRVDEDGSVEGGASGDGSGPPSDGGGPEGDGSGDDGGLDDGGSEDGGRDDGGLGLE
ncbi:hypothetical protein E1264_39355, partial [Actinomadura sp. KC216]